ncbi:MAG TPA: OadG family transporter subunit [Anaerolineaceae bacterium]|nr:OadG family transporter subunit [Anaerolineaceae bacterium]HPN53724.1 OadG family transporter subunit [Anaerolineaceae bacterium]
MSPIEQGLLITLIGMGLVFIVIVLLWFLMDLLVRSTADKVEEEEETPEETADVTPLTEETAPVIASDIKKRAAAAAVAVALASRRGMILPAQAAAPAATVGGWQAAHRSSQLLSKNVRGRTR